MTAVSAGVLDTSVFIARESGRPLDTTLIPDEVATTVITLAELNVGVLAAQTADIRDASTSGHLCGGPAPAHHEMAAAGPPVENPPAEDDHQHRGDREC